MSTPYLTILKVSVQSNLSRTQVYRVKQYKTPNCKTCPVKSSCTKSKSQRIIERHEFAEALEINKRNIAQNPEIYAQRQAIVEHPFGTIKRGWGFDHIMTKKSIERASADVGFIFIAYNLKRILNIIGFESLVKYLKKISLFILAKINAIQTKLSRFKVSVFFKENIRCFYKASPYRLKFTQY